MTDEKNDSGFAKEIEKERLTAWIHPTAYKAINEISDLHKISGLGNMTKQEHVTLAILLYSKELRRRGIKNGDDIRAKLNL